jgi:hypothetical protein
MAISRQKALSIDRPVLLDLPFGSRKHFAKTQRQSSFFGGRTKALAAATGLSGFSE